MMSTERKPLVVENHLFETVMLDCFDGFADRSNEVAGTCSKIVSTCSMDVDGIENQRPSAKSRRSIDGDNEDDKNWNPPRVNGQCSRAIGLSPSNYEVVEGDGVDGSRAVTPRPQRRAATAPHNAEMQIEIVTLDSDESSNGSYEAHSRENAISIGTPTLDPDMNPVVVVKRLPARVVSETWIAMVARTHAYNAGLREKPDVQMSSGNQLKMVKPDLNHENVDMEGGSVAKSKLRDDARINSENLSLKMNLLASVTLALTVRNNEMVAEEAARLEKKRLEAEEDKAYWPIVYSTPEDLVAFVQDKFEQDIMKSSYLWDPINTDWAQHIVGYDGPVLHPSETIPSAQEQVQVLPKKRGRPHSKKNASQSKKTETEVPQTMSLTKLNATNLVLSFLEDEMSDPPRKMPCQEDMDVFSILTPEISVTTSDEILEVVNRQEVENAKKLGKYPYVVLDRYYKCKQCRNKCFVSTDLSNHFKYCKKYLHKNYNNVDYRPSYRQGRVDQKLRKTPVVILESHYNCPGCRKKFLIGSKSLERHLKLKNKCVPDEEIECERCGDRFASQSRFWEHVNRHHEGVAKYKCPCCSNMLRNIKEHLAFYHLGVVPRYPIFKCNACPKYFRSISERKKHEIAHHEIDRVPFKCSVCNVQYRGRGSMISHAKKHHSGVLFKCCSCTGAIFCNEKDRDFHNFTKHGGKNATRSVVLKSAQSVTPVRPNSLLPQQVAGHKASQEVVRKEMLQQIAGNAIPRQLLDASLVSKADFPIKTIMSISKPPNPISKPRKETSLAHVSKRELSPVVLQSGNRMIGTKRTATMIRSKSPEVVTID